MENAKFQPAFVQGGNPASVNEQTPHLVGQLGITVEVGNKKWQYVKLDSGAVAANTCGAVASKDLAFWKDRANYIVTNDLRQAPLGRSGVAGVFGAAITAGYHCFIQRGGTATVNQDNGTAAAGTWGSAYSGTGCGVDFRSVGGTAALYPEFCVANAADDSGVSVELYIDRIG